MSKAKRVGSAASKLNENDGEENPEAIAIKSAINNMDSINIINQVLEDTIL